MLNILFGVPLNLDFSSWVVIIVASLGFIIMFGISSALGDFQSLIETTLENDKISRNNRRSREDNSRNRKY